MTRLIINFAIAALFAIATAEAAAPAAVTTGHARAELFAEHDAAAAGEGTWLALRLTLDRVRLHDVAPDRAPRRVRVAFGIFS